MPHFLQTSKAILAASAMVLLAGVMPAEADVRDWMLLGDNVKEYQIGYSDYHTYGGKPSGGIQSSGFNMSGSGIIARRVPAKEWWGKRVRFSCVVKTVQTQGTVGAWVGLETKTEGKKSKYVTVKSTLDQPLTGSNDWTQRSVVLSVPPGTDNLLIGVELSGRGLALLNNVRIDEEFDLPKPTDLNDFVPSR
jgi:hypothetical protein